MAVDRLSPTAAQIDIVRWTASLGAITAEALALRSSASPASARARLACAQRRGLLDRTRPLNERPALYSVTRAGMRACDARGIPGCRIATHAVEHLIACAMAAAALERCYPEHRVIGERELRRNERGSQRPLASAQLGVLDQGRRRLHRPDLVLCPEHGDGRPVAVEVELTIKSPRRLLEITRGWSRSREVAGVLYLAGSPAVERALNRAISRAHVEGVVVLPLTALPGPEVIDKQR